MSWTEGPFTVIAGEDLSACRRVKVKSGTTSLPVEVVYADAGEDFIGFTKTEALEGESVAIDPINRSGIQEVVSSGAYEIGAVLYGAADGKMGDTSIGNAQAIALERATSADEHVQAVVWSVKSTTAGGVSVSDTAGHFTGATVEAVLAEIGLHLHSTQKSLPLPLGSLLLEDGTALTKFSAGESAVPGFAQFANKELALEWNDYDTSDKVAVSVPIPPDLDGASDLVVHFLAAMSGATDTPTLETEAYFGAGDTDCAGADPEIDGGATLGEYTMTIAAADVPDAPSALTVIFGPAAGELTADDLKIHAVWLEYTGKTLTA